MTFTLEQTKAALAEVFEERGDDFVYNTYDGCYYGPTPENPELAYGCAVGGVVQKLDPELFEKFVKFERENNTSFTVTSLRGGAPYSVGKYVKVEKLGEQFDFDPDSFFLLDSVQGAQDSGKSYGNIRKHEGF